MNHRTALYRVYFTVAPTTYYVIEARNARLAVWRAKRTHCALSLSKRRTAELQVAKIERLEKNRERQLKGLPA
jgi:hypothetical protein